jgi:hypothetical protein
MYNGSEEEGRAAYKEFLDIGEYVGNLDEPLDFIFLGPIADMAKELPYEELNTLQVSAYRSR